jgi:NitT/TauT family transport system permease protein
LHSIKIIVKDVLPPLVSFLLLIAVWEAVLAIFHFDAIVLPSPMNVVTAIAQNPATLFRETGTTMLESVAGFLAGSVIAYLLAVTFVFSRPVQRSLYPYAIALKSTPLIAVAPLLTLWFGNGIFSKVIMSAMVAFFPVLVNSVAGLAAVDSAMLDLMKSLSANWWQVLMKVRIPNSLPFVFASLKTASSLAVVGAVIGEFTGANEGIGHLLTTSSYYLNTPLVFAGVIFITLAGLVFFGLVAYIEKLVVFW